MTTPRLSRLQKRILSKLMADERRTKGGLSSSHPELVQALPHAKGNISHSLRRLEAQGLIFMGRTPGGKTEYLHLTPEGKKRASELALSYD
jgi:DNA-binding MarR family transcriptional regulator